MADVQKYSLQQELKKADNSDLMGSLSLMGMTALTFPSSINLMRATMFTSHLKQFLNILHPEFPYFFTNNENVVGKHSSAYKEAKHDYEVYKKIVKFDDILDEPRIYKLFIYDKEKEMFDVIERKEVEDLTENFGYQYNNDVIDSYEEGDSIPKGTVLYKSTSYDEDGNYGYGQNVTTMYTLDPYTSEDAAVVSRSFANRFTSIETEVITVQMNGNDFLLNLYGDEYEYKPLPEIGEYAEGYIAALRRQYNDQLLFDFKDTSLQHLHEGDSPIHIIGKCQVIDYTIYDNNEELSETPFDNQINKYLIAQNKYYKKIVKTCEEIIKSGKNYSQEIDYLYKRALEMIDTEKRWKDNDSAFNNRVVHITIKRVIPLAKGQKITGRYGNKSVISQIREDDEMPFVPLKDENGNVIYDENGKIVVKKQVDVMLNLLAIINRTTAAAPNELICTCICDQVRDKMRAMDNYVDKEKLLFDILYMFNEKEYEAMKSMYDKMKVSEQKSYIDDAINDGIYIHQPPMWETRPFFYRIRDILEKYPWLQPYDLYVNKWGRQIKTLSKVWLGEMYLLKQFEQLKPCELLGRLAKSLVLI